MKLIPFMCKNFLCSRCKPLICFWRSRPRVICLICFSHSSSLNIQHPCVSAAQKHPTLMVVFLHVSSCVSASLVLASPTVGSKVGVTPCSDSQVCFHSQEQNYRLFPPESRKHDTDPLQLAAALSPSLLLFHLRNESVLVKIRFHLSSGVFKSIQSPKDHFI